MATVWSWLPDSTPTLIVHVVSSLDKAIYDDNLCLVASNKQQIQYKKSKKQPENLEMYNF